MVAVLAVALRLLYAEASVLYAFGFWAKDWVDDMRRGWIALCQGISEVKVGVEEVFDEMAEIVARSMAAPMLVLER